MAAKSAKKNGSNGRKAPVRNIVRFVNTHKGREGNKVRVAVLECGHKRSTDMSKRKTARCNRCRIEGRGAKLVKKPAAKITKTAAATEKKAA